MAAPRIVLIDDHALCRNGLTELLERRGGMQVMAATGDAEQVAPLLREHRPDLLVLDGAANASPARATEFVGHHALLALAGKAKLASVPTRYSICAGPDNFEVMRLLAEARR